MTTRNTLATLGAIAMIALAGCGEVPSPGGAQRAGDGGPADEPAAKSRSFTPKRLKIGILSNLPSPSNRLSAPLTGGTEIEQAVSAGLVAVDDRRQLRPQLAEAMPTVENGLWQLLPDGRMETSWRLREGVRWHDGTPLTAEDLTFSARVAQDKDLPAFGNLALKSVESVEAVDARTVIVRWKQPYIEADTLFSTAVAVPLPRHLLETPYLDEKASFTQIPFWTTEFVSSGPFKLREWQTASYAILEAFDQYVLGRPRIDEVEVRFVADNNTMLANVLADAVDLLIGIRHLSYDQAVEVRQRWRSGTAEFGPNGWYVTHPQLLNPTPPIVTNVQFRRALLMAIDRQAMTDTLAGGFAPVAHNIFEPADPEFQPTDSSVVKYDYDPRRAADIIQGLGYARGPEGMFIDANGQRLSVEVRTTGDIEQTGKNMFASQAYWQQLGLTVDAVTIPPQRQLDASYRANFPAFETIQGGAGKAGLVARHSSKARLPENNFRGVGGTNYPRYMNPEHDALIERYLTTIPYQERLEVMGQIVHHLTDRVVFMGLYYIARPTVVSTRVTNVVGRDVGIVAIHNIHEWDIR